MKKIKIVLVTFLFAVLVIPIFGQMASLTNVEKEDVLYLMEEEKLAGDVYLTLGEKWDVQVFKNIPVSEQRHLSTVKEIATENNLRIPSSVLNDERGVFENKELKSLYNQLISSGEESLVNALKVGAKIEELDIKDLDEAITKTENAQLKQIYTRLRNASENHLRAFVRNMKKQGLDYQPIILSKAQFDGIISSENTKGACCSGKQGKGACKGENGASGKKTGCNGKRKSKGCCSKPAG